MDSETHILAFVLGEKFVFEEKSFYVLLGRNRDI